MEAPTSLGNADEDIILVVYSMIVLRLSRASNFEEASYEQKERELSKCGISILLLDATLNAIFRLLASTIWLLVMSSKAIVRTFMIASLLSFVLANRKTQKCGSIAKQNSSALDCGAMLLLSPEEQDYCLKSNFKTAHWASSSAPLASALPNRYTKEVKYFLGQFDAFSQFLNTRYPVGAMERICYTTTTGRNRDGKRSIISKCYRERAINASESSALWTNMQEFKKGTEEMAKNLLRRVQNGANARIFFEDLIHCWKSLYTAMARVEKYRMFSCSVQNLVGIRFDRNNAFSLVVMLTNAPHYYMMEERKRQYVLETWQLDAQGRVKAIRVPSYGLHDFHRRINSTTTRLQLGGGQAMRSVMANTRSKDTAVEHVMRLSSIHVESVADSITLSNIAILTLPALISSLIPISMFQLVHCTWKLLLYALVSDFIATLPLLFKGIELLRYAKMQHTGCVERVNDSRLLESVTQMEVSCASCTHHAWFAEFGITLVIVATAVLVLGIFIELVSYRRMLHSVEALKGMKERWNLQWHRRCWWERYKKGKNLVTLFCEHCTESAWSHCAIFSNNEVY